MSEDTMRRVIRNLIVATILNSVCGACLAVAVIVMATRL